MHDRATFRRLPLALWGAGLALITLSPAFALAAEQGDEIAHTVAPGDTLEGLARSYLATPRWWPQLQARNKVMDPRHLKPGSVVWIPVKLQPEVEAQVEFVHGQVRADASQDSARPAPPLTAGSRLPEGTQLDVGPDGFVAVRLADGSIVRVNAQSQVQLRQLRRRGHTGSVQSVIEVQRGSVESTVAPATDTQRRFQVRTPRAVTSVRGTHFGVALREDGQTTAAVLQGSVAVQSRLSDTPRPDAPAALLQPGQGLAVRADGTVGAPRPLLPAPDLQALPRAVHEPSLLALDVPAQAHAVAYQAVIARDADLTQVLRTGTFANGRLRWPMLEDGAYYLSVRSVDAEGIAGLPTTQPLTVKTQPVAPLYQAPPQGGVLSNASGHLQCTQVPGVRWYRIQVAKDADFSQPVLDETRLDRCSLAVAALPVGPYHWRAASVRELPSGQADQGPFAAGQTFVLAQQPNTLSAQEMQASDGGTTVSLRWQAQAGQRFRLQLAQSSGFDKPVVDTTLEKPEWTAFDLPAGAYLVRIQVLDPSGLQSDFSPPRSVRVGTGFSTANGLPVSDSSGEAVRRP